MAKVMIILDCCHRALGGKPVSHACGVPFLHLTVLKNINVKSYNQKLQLVRKQWGTEERERTKEKEGKNQRERREEPNRKNRRTKEKENEREPKKKRMRENQRE